jgi:hypothetical protein
MHRAKVWVWVMGGCVVLSLCLIGLFGRPDETESIVRRHGTARKRYFPSTSAGGQDRVAIEVDLESTDPVGNAIYQELVQEGWTPMTGRLSILLTPGRKVPARALFPTKNGKVHVIYSRPANQAERFLHGIKSMLRLPGG